jgi:[acyl-carrier-protein] S-malonyltransferase
MALVFLFPGQNSRYPGMIDKLADLHPGNARLVERASDTLGRDLRAHFRAGNQRQFDRNRDVQVGVFLANELMRATLERTGIEAAFSAGLSLGEYNHLVHIGALRFEDALVLLQARGDAYDDGPRGVMYAVHPIEAAELEPAVARAGRHRIAIGVHAAPRQCVLSGGAAAVEAVIAEVESGFFVESSVVDPRLPMHSPLYDPVARRLAPALEQTPFWMPWKPYLPNARGRFEPDTSACRLRELLAMHVCRPVLWRESLEAIDAQVPDPVYVEVGVKSVLTNLMGRRWLDRPRFAPDPEEGLEGHLARTIQEIKHAARRLAIAG